MSTFDEKAREVQDRLKADPALGKKMAKYGAIGAVIAIPLPFVGPVFGAIAGAALAYSQRNKD
jgi:uncharacterized membrane protein